MRFTVTYEVSDKGLGLMQAQYLDHLRKGPLSTGLDATNAQLEAEGSKVRLKIVEVRKSK